MSITKENAEKIVEKLGATISPKKNRPHDLYHIYHNGQLVTSLGICRSSKKDKGHGHIPKALHVTPNQAQRLADCNFSEKDWIALMVEKGIIPT